MRSTAPRILGGWIRSAACARSRGGRRSSSTSTACSRRSSRVLGLDPESAGWAERIHRFADGVDWPAEHKRYAVSFHYRTHPDVEEAEAKLRAIAAQADAAGFRTRWGRMVMEVLPPVDADKGRAVRFLLGRRPEVRAALYAGDDTTDLDGFRGLGEAGLELAVRVGVIADESPDELVAAADILVNGTVGFLGLLRLL